MSTAHVSATPLLSVKDLRVHFQIRSTSAWPWAPSRVLKAVDGVSFELRAGETLGIVGESGCGKSTLARALLNLVPITDGSVVWHGDEMRGASQQAWQAKRKAVQMIFQDPLASLDPPPESVPVNALVAVPGTPLEAQPKIDPLELVRTIATARILMPKSRVRLSAGRTALSREAQVLCFLVGANSIFYGDKLLTTGNPDCDADQALLKDAGLHAAPSESVSA